MRRPSTIRYRPAMASPEGPVTRADLDDITAGLHAQAYVLGLVRFEIHELHTETRDGFTAVNGRLDGMDSRLTTIEGVLTQILERFNR
jgi:hypothetical protein